MRICSSCYRCYDDTIEFCAENDQLALSESRSGSCEMIAGYRLEQLLESDLKGDLYRARQIECDQPCHVRIVSPPKKNSHQFLREAKHAAALFHPDLVDVYETGTLDAGRSYVVTEIPAGQTLRDYLNNVGVPPLLNTIDIVKQTAEALHAFHLEGLVHRAVRPENVILTTDQVGRSLVRIKELDFGGVIERSIISNKFLIDTALDAIRYFAPEQCTGGKTSVQTDIYSLGIVLYEMLAGSPPFDAAKALGLIEMHRHQQPREIRIENFELRMLLTHTLNEALQKGPERRHSSALAFARQLRHMEQLATHVSTPPPAMAIPPLHGASVRVSSSAAAPTGSMAAEPAQETIVPAKRIELFGPFVTEIESDLIDPWMHEEPSQMVGFEISPAINDLIAAPPAVVQTVIAQQAPKERLDRESHRARVRRRKNRSKNNVARRPSELPAPEVERSQISEEPAAVKQIQRIVSPAPARLGQFEGNEITSVTARREAAVIEWEQYEDDIPSIEDVLEVLSAEQITPAFEVGSPAEPISLPIAIVDSASGLELNEIRFVPGLMRESRDDHSIDLYPNYSILSAYGPTPTARLSFDYQTLLRGVGAAALVAIFFAANVMFRRIVPTEAPAAPTSVSSEPNETDQAQIVQQPVAKNLQKTVQKQRPADVVSDPSVAVSVGRSQVLADSLVQTQPATTSPVRTAVKMPPIASTLVISMENGKLRSTIETPRRPADQRSPIAVSRPNTAGRPRIVGNPSQ
jgi:serine/threonine protein kinase